MLYNHFCYFDSQVIFNEKTIRVDLLIILYTLVIFILINILMFFAEASSKSA